MPRQRFGKTDRMGRGFGITAAVDHGVVRELARRAEELGYSSFWVNDIPHAEGLDSLAAAATTTTNLRLGVGVIPLDTRPPNAIEERIRNLGVPIDRLVLGVGSGHSGGALERVRTDAPALHASVGAIVVVGALGPKMAALAGEVADGVLLNWMTPHYVARLGQLTADAAERTHRARPQLMAYVRCGFAPAAEPRLRQELHRYAGVTSFEHHVERMGVSGAATCVLESDASALQAGIARFETVLDETVVRAITPTDGIDDLVALLEACAPTS